MKELSIDIETYSDYDLKKCGMYKYVESPNFKILLFAWAFDNEPVQITTGDKIPIQLKKALIDPSIKKTAYNAAFEITCLSKFFPIKVSQWECTMAKAAMLGLRPGLDGAGISLNLDTSKDKAGYNLIRYFCIPNKAGIRNLPESAPDKWEAFKRYCIGDVIQERKVKEALRYYQVTGTERTVWLLDQKINRRGVRMDRDMIRNAQIIAANSKVVSMKRSKKLTGLDNPNSPKQLTEWLQDTTGKEITSLNKKFIPELLDGIEDPEIKEVLELRGELSKTSVRKYAAMESAICEDGRFKGSVQYYGAPRTGRFGGRLIQVHNLPRNTMKQLDLARRLVKDGHFEALSLLWDSPQNVLSQLLRTAFIPSDGNTLLISDFAAIEARITAWLAGENWRLEVFRTHGKIYEASASAMFRIPIDQITKDSPERYKGKVSELALGFGGGPNALITMGALDMGIEEDELPDLVKMWRNASPKICHLWYNINDLAIESVENPGTETKHKSGITFKFSRGNLWIKLLSGRHLVYPEARLIPGKYEGTLNVSYMGMNQYTHKWERLRTYGGKLVENICQATARDLLCHAMIQLERAGFPIVMHVHDEVVIEVKPEDASIIKVNKIMSTGPDWAKGLPLGAESFISPYYKKE